MADKLNNPSKIERILNFNNRCNQTYNNFHDTNALLRRIAFYVD